MGLNEMAEELIRGAKAEAERIEADGKGKADETVAEAKARGAKLIEEAKAEAAAVAKNEKQEKLSASHLEAKRIVSQAKDKAIREAMKDILEGTAAARDTDYKALLKRLITQGFEEIGKDAVVMTNKQDQKLAHSLGFKVAEESVDCIGGAVVSSPDGKAVFRNTFEARFETRKEYIRTAVHRSLFGKDGMKAKKEGGGKAPKK